jgi:thiamine-monophosphate kinase
MAAEPVGALVSLAVARQGPGPERFMVGVRERLDELAIPLLGGDLTRSPGPAILDAAVVGRTRTPLLRSGARSGDHLWVTGRLGGAAASVAVWRAGKVPGEGLRDRFARPQARIREALWLKGHCRLSAGLDLSDGLAGDAGHLAAASGVGILLVGGAVPVDPAVRTALAALPSRGGSVDDAALQLALHGGDDYELLLAAPPGGVEPWVEEFHALFDLSLTQVGEVTRERGVWMRRETEGDPVPLTRGGWDHFGSDPGEPGDGG